MQNELNIIDALFLRQPSYIVLISSLLPNLEEVVADVAKDLNFTYLCFNHIETDYNPVNKRVHQLLEKKQQGIIVCGSSFPTDKLDFHVNYHIHLSLNKTMFSELKIKTDYDTYTEGLKSNFINKYINIKPEFDVQKIGDEIFNRIINHIDSIVHVKK